MRRRWLIPLIPVLALAIWLVAMQFPRWTVAHAGWFPEEIPGVCAAVAYLRGVGATARSASADARVTAFAAGLAMTSSQPPLASSTPLAIRHVTIGDAWLVTYAYGDPDAAGSLIEIVVFSDDGTPRARVHSAADGVQSCERDLGALARGALVSVPGLAFAAYVSGGMIIGVASLFRRRWIRGRRT